MKTNNPLVETIKQLPYRIVNTGTIREDMQNILFDADDSILTEQGACAIICGDSGTGKTVLVEKLVERFNVSKRRETTQSNLRQVTS